jgi:hypothetical protein
MVRETTSQPKTDISASKSVFVLVVARGNSFYGLQANGQSLNYGIDRFLCVVA